MGCDVHLGVCVVDQSTNKIRPVLVHGRLLGNEPLTTGMPGGVFRNYDIFGLLHSSVRGGGWLSEFAVECRGQINVNQLDLGRYSAEQLKKDVEQYRNSDRTGDNRTITDYEKAYNDLRLGIANDYPLYVAGYLYGDWVHSHNYFTCADLKRVIRRLKKYRKTIKPDSWLDLGDVIELKSGIDNAIDMLKRIICDARAYSRLSDWYTDYTDDQIVILCCFDS